MNNKSNQGEENDLVERNWRKLTLVNGEILYVDVAQVAMLQPMGANTKLLLGTGWELTIAGDIAAVDTVLGELRLRGVNGFRINPDHVVAIESLGAAKCRLHISTGLSIDAEGISALDLSRAIERHGKYPWDTIRLVPAQPAK